MRPECSRAATAATAPLESTQVVYSGTARSASAINDVLARLLFGLESPHVTRPERLGILDAIDGLLRLKIDVGLLKGAQHE